jgi:hypothetical protein
MFPSSLAIALTGLALGLLALGAFAWGWRQGQFSHLRARREVFKYGGIGGLVGLSLSALVSLGIVAMPGFAPPGIIAVVQLLGPNIGTSPRVAYRGIANPSLGRRRERSHQHHRVIGAAGIRREIAGEPAGEE